MKFFLITSLMILSFFKGLSSLAPKNSMRRSSFFSAKNSPSMQTNIMPMQVNKIQEALSFIDLKVSSFLQSKLIPQNFNEDSNSVAYHFVKYCYNLASLCCQSDTMELLIIKIIKVLSANYPNPPSEDFIAQYAKKKAPYFIQFRATPDDLKNKKDFLKQPQSPFEELMDTLSEDLSPFRQIIKFSCIDKKKEILIQKIKDFPWKNASLWTKDEDHNAPSQEKLFDEELNKLFREIFESGLPSIMEAFIENMLEKYMKFQVENKDYLKEISPYYTKAVDKIFDRNYAKGKIKQGEERTVSNLINEILIHPRFYPLNKNPNKDIEYLQLNDNLSPEIIETQKASLFIHNFILNLRNPNSIKSLEPLHHAFKILANQYEERPTVLFRILRYLEDLSQLFVGQDSITQEDIQELKKIYQCFSFSNNQNFLSAIQSSFSSSFWQFYSYAQLMFERLHLSQNLTEFPEDHEKIQCFFSNKSKLLEDLYLKDKIFEIKNYNDFLKILNPKTFQWKLVQEKKEILFKKLSQKYTPYQFSHIKYMVDFLFLFYLSKNNLLTSIETIKSLNQCFKSITAPSFILLDDYTKMLLLNEYLKLKSALKTMDLAPKTLDDINEKISFLDSQLLNLAA